jgi:hypothetical protein
MDCNSGTLHSYDSCTNLQPVAFPVFSGQPQHSCISLGIRPSYNYTASASFDCAFNASAPIAPYVPAQSVTPAPFVHVSGSAPSCHSGFVWLVLLSCLLFLYL